VTSHLVNVAASWGLAALGFGGLAIGAAWRHRAAARRLRELERTPGGRA